MRFLHRILSCISVGDIMLGDNLRRSWNFSRASNLYVHWEPIAGFWVGCVLFLCPLFEIIDSLRENFNSLFVWTHEQVGCHPFVSTVRKIHILVSAARVIPHLDSGSTELGVLFCKPSIITFQIFPAPCTACPSPLCPIVCPFNLFEAWDIRELVPCQLHTKLSLSSLALASCCSQTQSHLH